MSKYIVVVFDDAKAAYEGARAVGRLDYEGDLAVYEGAVISKDEDGKVRVQEAVEEGPVGWAAGMMLGSLIGVLGGPAGVLAGAAAGSLSGLMFDIGDAGVNDQFLDDVAGRLTPGKYAVVADVDEGWTAPLDTRMEALGGTVFRSWRIDVEDEQIDRDIEATARELDELEADWKKATGEAKAKLKARVDATKQRLEALKDRTQKKVESLKEQSRARIQKLDEQIAKAKADFKTKLEKTRAETKADYEKRIAKLEKAKKLTSEALA
jgi:uncharacterized membrane protein